MFDVIEDFIVIGDILIILDHFVISQIYRLKIEARANCTISFSSFR